MIGTDMLRAINVLAILFRAFLPLHATLILFLLIHSLSFQIAVKQFFVPAKVAIIPDTVKGHDSICNIFCNFCDLYLALDEYG